MTLRSSRMLRLMLVVAVAATLTCCVNSAGNKPRLAVRSTPAASAAANQRGLVRVLVFGANSESQRQRLEEAVSLSVDLPSNEARVGAQPSSNQSTSGQDNVEFRSPSGYRQVSLASLNLHQRQPASSTRVHQNSPIAKNNPIQNQNKTTTSSGSRNRKRNSSSVQSSATPNRRARANQSGTSQSNQTNTASTKPKPWVEMYMSRVKPSWLDVDQRFKITGSSIEEIRQSLPADYLLRPAFDSPVLLKTKLGVLEGTRSLQFNKYLYSFLSVPYAKAPVGSLRFKAPQGIDKWQGVRQATKWPPFCVQPSMTLASKSSPVHLLTQVMTEDCLYLNIWTPSLKQTSLAATGSGSSGGSGSTGRPVMVWIHGGAFQYGGISVDENDGSALALLGDLVVVTLSYRVSAFGFLNANNPQEAPNNVGLLDQRMALLWVQENIRQFGGDPRRVTLFGESAGGHSVGFHLVSPASHAFFKRAIFQSGVPISMIRSYDVNPDNEGPITGDAVSSIMMARRLKCLASPPATPSSSSGESSVSGENDIDPTTTELPSNPSATSNQPTLNDTTIECLRSKSSLEILKAMGAPGSAGFFPTGNDPLGFFPNGTISESFDPSEPKFGPQKDFLIGTNTDEGTFMLHYGLPSVFPARDVPIVGDVDSLKSVFVAEMARRQRTAPEGSLNNTSTTANAHTNTNKASNQSSTSAEELESASGDRQGGAQAHLYKPLMRIKTSLLESFMPQPQHNADDQSNQTTTTNSTLSKQQVERQKRADFGRGIGSLVTDILFLCPSRSLARTLSETGRNVYFYLYKYRSSLSQYHEWLGVTHHDEVEFVFGRPIRMADVHSGKDIEMSQRMIKTWSYFAHTGQMLSQHKIEWPKYDAEDNKYMILDSQEASIGTRYHDRFCNLYETVISVHLQDT